MSSKRVLLFAFAVALSLTFIIFQEALFVRPLPHPEAETMTRAHKLAATWMRVVNGEKQLRGISNTLPEQAVRGETACGIAGEEYTPVTTTLGSPEAKAISGNPLFAALIVRLVSEAGLKRGSTVAVILSGSFPSLAVSTFAALQSMDMQAVVISSLGSSSFGANQKGALWTDMESWLREKGGCRYWSSLITYGAEGDSGGGMDEEARTIFDESLHRNDVNVFIPASVDEAMAAKIALIKKAHSVLLINIGGNQTALGYCSHAEGTPNGLHTEQVTCRHEGRGIISRLSENGMPFIHLLNIKNLATKYAISEESRIENHPLLFEQKPSRWAAGGALMLIFLPVILYYRARKK